MVSSSVDEPIRMYRSAFDETGVKTERSLRRGHCHIEADHVPACTAGTKTLTWEVLTQAFDGGVPLCVSDLLVSFFQSIRLDGEQR